MEFLSFLLCCKPDKKQNIEKIKVVEISDDTGKVQNINNSNINNNENNFETIEKKNSFTKLMNQSLEKRNQSLNVNSQNDLPIFDQITKSRTGKLLYINPPLSFPNLFLNHKDIIIDEFGIRGSPKENKGRLVFFGIDSKYSQMSNTHINDVLINEEITHPKINKTHAIFYIYFDPSLSYYFLKCLYKEIYFSLVLKPYTQVLLDCNHKNYIKIGKVILSISIKNKEEIIYIKIKKSETIDKEQDYFFNREKMPITIGRSNCSICIKCDTVSKTHITIDYDKINQNFFIIDNSSTNGTQLLLNEGKNIQLHGEMNFNLGEKQFQIIEK